MRTRGKGCLLCEEYFNNTRWRWFCLQCYKKILELEPENVQGLHNLCVVYVERGNLLEAENCLQRVHNLAPHEDYIIKHLQIVQTRISKYKLQPNSKVSSGMMCVFFLRE